MKRFYFAVAMLALAAAPSVEAHEYQKGSLHIAHPWARPTAGESRVGAAYLEIHNRGQQDDKLISATSPVAGTVELHAIIQNADVLKMRRLEDGIKLPGDAAVKFEPGGLHLMLIDLKQKLKDGDKIPVTLRFEKAGEVQVEANVENRVEVSAPSSGGGHHPTDLICRNGALDPGLGLQHGRIGGSTTQLVLDLDASKADHRYLVRHNSTLECVVSNGISDTL